MKLKDFKQGMICKLRNKESIKVLNSEYYFISGWRIFNLGGNFNEDLTHKEHKQFDIMEVNFGNDVVFKRSESIELICPKCREGQHTNTAKFCSECGQRLDWSELENE